MTCSHYIFGSLLDSKTNCYFWCYKNLDGKIISNLSTTIIVLSVFHFNANTADIFTCRVHFFKQLLSLLFVASNYFLNVTSFWSQFSTKSIFMLLQSRPMIPLNNHLKKERRKNPSLILFVAHKFTRCHIVLL